MLEIEEYFNNNLQKIDTNFLLKHFNCENQCLLKIKIDLNLWANDKMYSEDQSVRTKQEIFRQEILKRDKKCVITEQYNETECEACHILPVKDGGTYDLNNGLLINSNHHKTFDKNLWCINPDTFQIDILVNDKHKVGSIYDYNHKIVNIPKNSTMKLYLEKRWILYMNYKNSI
jgi:predicted restriction endonuclease